MRDTNRAGSIFVEVCQECRRHAHFVCGDAEISGEFFSQEQALAIARVFYQDGDISHGMLRRLIIKIRRSDLPAEIPDGMKYLLEIDENLTAFLDRENSMDELLDDLHGFFETFFPELPMTIQ